MSYKQRVVSGGDASAGGESFAPMPCGICQQRVPPSMLIQYGARCRSCFDAYCREANPGHGVVPSTRAEKVAVLEGLRGAVRVVGGEAA